VKAILVKPTIKLSDHIQPPLGLGYIAGNLDRTRNKVSIIDLSKLGIKMTEFGNFLKQEKPDVVGFQCYTSELGKVKELVNQTRKILNNAVIVVGGPHPTLMPEETLKFFGNGVNFLFCGEVEKSFPLFLEKLKNGGSFKDVKGLVWQENGKTNLNQPELIEDLDSLSFPAWDLIKPQEYPPAQHGAFYKKFPIAPIITTRGCPFACSFCCAPLISGKKVRRRSIELVLKEIYLLYHNFGIREIHIVDDNFTIQ
jgi:radical SAM superfamily enzyme YgiQ (UPF0313 family)